MLSLKKLATMTSQSEMTKKTLSRKSSLTFCARHKEEALS